MQSDFSNFVLKRNSVKRNLDTSIGPKNSKNLITNHPGKKYYGNYEEWRIKKFIKKFQILKSGGHTGQIALKTMQNIC